MRSSLAAAAIVAISVAGLRAQSTMEVWQAVLSLPTIGGSGLPAMPVPTPGLAFPTGVAQTLTGDLVVADSGNNLVRIFDATTGIEKTTITGGSRPMSWPSGVKVDACGHLLVTDYGYNRLREFSADGTEIGSPVDGLYLPWGLAMTAGTVIRQGCTVNGAPLSVGGRLAVVNSLSSDGTGGGSVNVYDGNLTLLFSLGSSDDAGKLSAPVGVAIDPSTGNFFVTDAGSPKAIKVYGPTGAFLFSFTDPSFSFPDDIVFDPQGRIVVADSLTQVVDFFTLNYDSVNPSASTVTLDFSITQDNTPGTFLAPSGLAFDSDGRMLVTTGTYDPATFLPVASTQYVLIFDRPTLAVRSVDVSSGGSAVTTALPPGTPLTFTVTAIASTGQVNDAVIAGTVTSADGVTQIPLGSKALGTIVAGTPVTATFTYSIPAGITSNSSISFAATATGTVNNGTSSTPVTAPGFAPAVVHVVVTGDMTPPVTAITLNPATPPAGGWYDQPMAITLTASDEPGGSGIASLVYKFGGLQLGADPIKHTITATGGATSLTANTDITQDGATASTITYWAVDKAGNAETPHTQSFQLDRTPPYATFGAPVPSATAPSSSPVSWWNRSVTIPFTAVDRGSGVASYTPSNKTVSFSAEGANQKRTVSITDNAGNTSDPANGLNTSPTVNIDLTAPVAGTPTAAPAPNSNGWNNSPVQVTFAATDNLSGFLAADSASGVNSDLNGRRVMTLSQDGRGLSPASQTFSDLAGNLSAPETYSKPIDIDRTPPTVTATSYLKTGNLSQPLVANSNGWFNSLVTVRMSATDNLSGFAAGDAANGVAGTLQGVKSQALAEGTHAAASLTINDLAGNSAAALVSPVNIDVTAPTVGAPVFTDRTTGTAVSPSTSGWLRGQIDVSFTATDALSGFSDGSTDARSIALAPDQANQVVAVPTVTDLAGNTSAGYTGNPTATTVTASVDSTPPQIVVTPSSAAGWTDTSVTPNRLWYGAPASVTFSATDLLSGFGGGTSTTSTTQAVPEGIDETVSQAFTDQAGNSAAASFGPVSMDLTPPTITATVTSSGANETMTFTAADAGSGLASCVVAVGGTVVQQTCDPITVTASDSGKVITATATDRVGHTAASTTSVSFAPPEAYNQFDPVSHDVLVYGFDPTTGVSLGVIVPSTITRDDTSGIFCQGHDGNWFGPFPRNWWATFSHVGGWDLRVYRLAGSPGNALTLVEAVHASGHEIHVQVVGFQYTVNGATEPFIFAPDATKTFTWSLNGDGSLRRLNQDMGIGRGRNKVDVQANYTSRSGNTSVRVKVQGPDTRLTLSGLALLRMATNRAGSNLMITADGLTPVPGPAGSTVEDSGGYTWGSGGGGGSGSGGNQGDQGGNQGDQGGDHGDQGGNQGDQGGNQGDQGGNHDGDHNGDHDGDHSTNHPPVLVIGTQTSHEGEVVGVQVSGTDPDGDALTYTATGLPPGLAMSATGLVAGPLSYASAGTYAVTVTAADAKGAHTSSAFTWTVANVDRAPTLTVPNQSNDEGDFVALQVTGQDPDGDALMYAASGLPTGLAINASTGLISGALSDESAGTHAVTMTVTDAGEKSATASVTWTVTDVDDTPSPAGAAQIRHAPTLNGSSVVAGSLHVMSAENIVFNGSAAVTGHLFVPGMPTVRINGTPALFGGTKDATGATTPAGYVVTLNGGTTLGQLIRRENPETLPAVAPPSGPDGNRNVSLNNGNDAVGDFGTVRNLTLNGNVGAVSVPAGSYGSFTANGANSFVLGEAGSTTPAVYNFQNLTLNGSSRVTAVGPVVITLGNGPALSGSIGNTAHPEWTVIAVASGGLTLNSNVTVAGTVIAPYGTVTINGGCQLLGRLFADGLTLNSSGRLTLIGQ